MCTLSLAISVGLQLFCCAPRYGGRVSSVNRISVLFVCLFVCISQLVLVAKLSLTNLRAGCITTNGKILIQSRDHYAHLGVMSSFGNMRYSLPVYEI